MMSDFENLSKEIANDFLQSIVFIDDNAYRAPSDDPKHEFDAQAISKAFANDKKICAVYNPESENDIDTFSLIAKKADVTVIDWQIIFTNDTTESQTDEVAQTDEEEDDDDIDDIRGLYTKKIIKELLISESSRNSLKLIIIYTGDNKLSLITNDIATDLINNGISGFATSINDSCCVFSNSCKILVRSKSNGGEGRNRHNPELADKEVTYDDLPVFIASEFTKMTSGLLSNFALQSLTAIRQNFYQILNIFSKELDSAYLTHQSLLPNSDDANELLVDLIGDTFTSILRAKNLNSKLNQEVTNSWIEHYIKDEEKPKFNNRGKLIDETFTRNKVLLAELLKSHPKVINKFRDALDTVGVSKGSTDKNHRKYAFNMFHDNNDYESKNKKFALLCQHKDLICHDEHTPALALGTVVKSTIAPFKYLLCIQQRCDSIRLSENESRRFLFLSLSIVDGNEEFSFLTPDGKKLKLDKNTYGIRTVKFPGSHEQVVNAMKEEASSKLLFEPLHYSVAVENADVYPGTEAGSVPVENPDVSLGSEVTQESKKLHERFEFVFELKELYAQRVVADYSASLARVGVDEPEWVRNNCD